ncbi:CrcB protein [Microbacterium terrae]|uniref:Fluoride-specific ion channel FluC n=1 Tax=Microbacterium terrae TaxID=69369 RepID=A0A0M2HKJ4_9MICO|nr:CrcB family protein [Microbacterium terrae]KJL45403.1 putative fluoride ion transporter CrcB [Microbacterium terrae]MBP1078726.1 CrcB protein [Microbacterium terrae]GLJ98127.1 putative fluoride ion transporter CrcB 2 [Microbacterium terrae]
MPHPLALRTVAVAAAGGAIGVFARALIVLPIDDPAAAAWATMGVNALGSLLLGIVVGWLDDRRPLLRGFLGTGVLGGFTTYSAFAVQTVGMAAEAPLHALMLVAASLGAGVLGAAMGLAIGRRLVDAPGGMEPVEAAE